MSHFLFPQRYSRVVLLTVACLSASWAGAASHCKGMAESACANDAACTWVESYTRKDGRQVSAHCKLARGKKSLDVSALMGDLPKKPN